MFLEYHVFFINPIKCLMFMQIAKLRILKTTAFDHFTNDVQFVNDER